MALLHTLETKGFIYFNGEIESLTYADYLSQFCSDETTTPKGVAPRLHIRETDENFELWTWGIGGNNPHRLETFTTEEEATKVIYESWECSFQQMCDIPLFYDDENSLYEELAISFDKPTEVVRRFFAFKTIKDRRDQEAKKQRAHEKIILQKEIEAEADKIIPDFDFVQTISYINDNPELYAGEEKSNALRIAFLSLLHRQNYGFIKTNFWKVFRIINKRISGDITT